MYVKNRVHSILTDKRCSRFVETSTTPVSFIPVGEKPRMRIKRAIDTLQDHIKHYPKSPELEKWKEMLRFNRHDFELHKGEVDLILEAIHDIRDQNDRKTVRVIRKGNRPMKRRNRNGYRYQRAAQRQREIQTRKWYQLMIEYQQLLRNPRS